MYLGISDKLKPSLNGGGLLVQFQCDVDRRERQGMTEGDELRGLLGAHDAGNLEVKVLNVEKNFATQI